MIGLCGKGVWLTRSYDLQRAIEMATIAEATHLLVKVGHGPFYFPETARQLVQRVRGMGFHPLAWLQLTDHAPQEALVTIEKALAHNYEAVILYIDTALVTSVQLAPLAEALKSAGLPQERLLFASPPPHQLPDPQVWDMIAPHCRGGWMPLCFAAWGTPEQVIDADVYQALGRLSMVWGSTPPVYPVISPLATLRGGTLLPEAFIPWIQGIMQHGVDFFSIYHVAATEKVFWPLVQAVRTNCQERDLAAASAPTNTATANTIIQPIYITVATGDTIWGIISRYGITKAKFWEWNGNLWDSRGLPRDPDYMQEGWRVRVK